MLLSFLSLDNSAYDKCMPVFLINGWTFYFYNWTVLKLSNFEADWEQLNLIY